MKTQLPEPNPDDALGASFRNRLQHNYSKLVSTNLHWVLISLCLIIVVVPLSAKAGVLAAVSELLSGEEFVYERPLAKQTAGDVKLLSAGVSPDPTANQGGGDIIVEEGTLVSSGPFTADDYASNSGQISIHTIRPCTEAQCETLSHIADMYGVSVNTILWANDIDDPNLIKPGDNLVILPITGVRHLVKDGDTLNKIAKKYGAETDEQVEAMVADILDYNRLASAADISVGDTVVVPGGAMHTAAPTTNSSKSSSPTRVATKSSSASGLVHPVPGAIKTQGIHGYNAVDLAAAAGTAVRAAADGEVILSRSSGWNGGYGIYIVIRHANGVQTLYSHLSQNYVGVGASVSAGETIGAVGSSGKSTGPHLHFEVRGATNPF